MVSGLATAEILSLFGLTVMTSDEQFVIHMVKLKVRTSEYPFLIESSFNISVFFCLLRYHLRALHVPGNENATEGQILVP